MWTKIHAAIVVKLNLASYFAWRNLQLKSFGFTCENLTGKRFEFNQNIVLFFPTTPLFRSRGVARQFLVEMYVYIARSLIMRILSVLFSFKIFYNLLI